MASSVHTVVDREKTAPFLVRTFVKINGFHRITLFEDGTLPTTDEHQLFTWRDATLPELITTLRIVSPTAEFRHPLARFSFRALFADSVSRGHFSQKDMGQVSSRDMLEDTALAETSENKLHSRTLEELRFVPGDFLSISVILPKNINLGAGPVSSLTIKGSAAAAGAGADANGKWGRGGPAGAGRGDAGWGGGVAAGPPGGLGRGGAHWRARPGVAAPPGRGAGGDVGGRDEERPPRRERDRDPLPPPRPRRADSPPPRSRPPIPERDRDRDRVRPRRSRSRSRSPPRRRGSRYD